MSHPAIDTGRPHSTRVCDALFGGNGNHPVAE
ncbi:SAM-dependent methyltransferase [Streptomyces sp. NBC_00316]